MVHQMDQNNEKYTHKEVPSEPLFRQFCENTTAHGLGSAVKEITKFGKRLWIIIFILACILNTLQLAMLVSHYFSYPTQDVTSVVSQKKTFPDVTICNKMGAPLDDMQKLIDKPGTKAGEYSQILKNPSSIGSIELALKHQYLSNYYEQIPLEEMNEFGPGFEDFVLSCRFVSNNCTNMSYFKVVYDLNYNKCFQFSFGNITSEWATAGYGSNMGLNLVLYLDTESSFNSTHEYSYLFPQRNSIGGQASISYPDTLISPSEHGWNLMPGYASSISMVASDIQRLPSPYSTCTDQEKSAFYDQGYSLYACESEHLQNEMMKTCGCVSCFRPVPVSLMSTVNFCGRLDLNNITDSEQRHICERTLLIDSSKSNESLSGCVAPCTETIYAGSLSQSLWPGPSYVDDFYHEYVTMHPNKVNLKAYKALNKEMTSKTTTRERKMELIHQNFLRLNVYYSSDQVQVIKQQASYGLADLMSDIGGTLGLWAGFSLITILEFLRFLLALTMQLMSPRKQRQTNPV